MAKKAAKAKVKAPKKKANQATKDRAKKGASAAAGTKPVRAKREPAPERTGPRKLPSANQVRSVAALMKTAASVAGEGRQRVGARVDQLAKDEKIDINMPAMREALKQARMGENNPVKLMTYREDLDLYCDALGVDKLAAENLFKEAAADDEAEGDEAEASAPTDNVESLAERRAAGNA